MDRLLHNVLRACEVDLNTKCSLSQYPLVKKKYFVRALNSINIRIARFIVIYRCYLFSNQIARQGQDSGQSARVNRAAELLSSLIREFPMKQHSRTLNGNFEDMEDLNVLNQEKKR